MRGIQFCSNESHPILVDSGLIFREFGVQLRDGLVAGVCRLCNSSFHLSLVFFKESLLLLLQIINFLRMRNLSEREKGGKKSERKKIPQARQDLEEAHRLLWSHSRVT